MFTYALGGRRERIGILAGNYNDWDTEMYLLKNESHLYLKIQMEKCMFVDTSVTVKWSDL